MRSKLRPKSSPRRETLPHGVAAVISAFFLQEGGVPTLGLGRTALPLAPTACYLAPGDLGTERVEALVPQRAVAGHEALELGERRGLERVDPHPPLGPAAHEARLAQHPQMAGHRGLADPELLLHDGRDLARGLVPGGEELDQAASDRVAEDVESVHGSIV